MSTDGELKSPMNSALSSGAKLSRYEIRSQLGKGGMGDVYLARDGNVNRDVALKVLPADFAADRERLQRFRQDAQAAASLNHPNIAHVYEIGEFEGTHFIAMEFIDGQTLRDCIHVERAELTQLLRYLQHVAEALAKAHAAGIVHRDLKPENIMINRDGLLRLRLLPAVAGATLVWLTGKLARELGGGRFAQALAALAVLIAPMFLVFHHWLTMNAFEPLIWLAAAWCVARAINTGRPSYWLWFGVLIGLGLETKYSIVFFAFGIVVGLLLTGHRRFLKSPWIWLGALAALLIFLPNLLWLVKHDFPFLELMRNIRESGRDVTRAPLRFIADQALIMNPILFPLWFGGLLWLFFGGPGNGKGELGERPANSELPGRGRYRIFGWAHLVMLVTLIVLKGKNYYLAPAYPILFAAGAIAFERITTKKEQTAAAVGRSIARQQEQEAGAGDGSIRRQEQEAGRLWARFTCRLLLPPAPGSGWFTSP